MGRDTAGNGGIANLFRQVYRYRRLVWVIATGDFKARYKNSVMGYFWSLLEPLFMLTVLWLVFTNLMKLQVEHYQLFLLLGMVMWNFYCKATQAGLNAIIGKPGLVQKVFFPREVLVVASCITASLMSLFESMIFVAFFVVAWVPLSRNVLFLPVLLAIFFMFALGSSFIVSALNVYYRDTQFFWAVILQAGFFLSPILYPLDIFPPLMKEVLMLNPIAQIIIGARNVVLYSTAPSITGTGYASVASVVMLVVGYWVFVRMEPKFAEAM